VDYISRNIEIIIIIIIIVMYVFHLKEIKYAPVTLLNYMSALDEKGSVLEKQKARGASHTYFHSCYEMSLGFKP